MNATYLKTIAVVFIGSLMMVAAPSCAFAQDPELEKLAKAMTDSLGYLQLTDAQKPQALELNKIAAASLMQTAQKAKKDESFKGKALVKEMAGTMKQRNQGLEKILSSQQKEIFAQHQVQQLAELQTKIMTAQLDLTDAQVPQVHKVNLEAATELLEDVQKLKDTKRKMKKARAAKGMKADSADKDKKLKAILTAEQYSLYEKNKQEMQAVIKEKMQEKKN